MISASNVHFAFKQRPVLNGISLSCSPGSITSVLGPSGSGKTTLLNILAGFFGPDHGTVSVDGDPPTVAARDGKIGLIPQENTLFPWLSVEANVSLPLRLRGDLERAHEAVLMAMRQARIDHAREKLPGELSGGMKTRAALARVLAFNPPVHMLDEPLNGLDDFVKEDILTDLEKIWREHKTTALLITHDIAEALRLSDRLYVILPAQNGSGAGLVHIEDMTSPRPRGSCFFQTQEFTDARSRILSCLKSAL